MTLSLKLGGYYKNNRGQVRGPMREYDGSWGKRAEIYEFAFTDHEGVHYSADGMYLKSHGPDDFDLIEEVSKDGSPLPANEPSLTYPETGGEAGEASKASLKNWVKANPEWFRYQLEKLEKSE